MRTEIPPERDKHCLDILVVLENLQECGNQSEGKSLKIFGSEALLRETQINSVGFFQYFFFFFSE